MVVLDVAVEEEHLHQLNDDRRKSPLLSCETEDMVHRDLSNCLQNRRHHHQRPMVEPQL